MTKLSATLLALLGAALVAGGPVSVPPVSAHTSHTIALANEKLERYRVTKSLKDLGDAIDALFSGSPVDTGEATSQLLADRRAMVAVYARMFRTIDDSYDPTFDPNDDDDLPTNCVLPPNGSITCNVDPTKVRDPKQRADYAASLAENRRKLRQANHYHDVSMVDASATTGLQMELWTFDDQGVLPDIPALHDIVARAGLTRKRRESLDRMLSPATYALSRYAAIGARTTPTPPPVAAVAHECVPLGSDYVVEKWNFIAPLLLCIAGDSHNTNNYLEVRNSDAKFTMIYDGFNPSVNALENLGVPEDLAKALLGGLHP